MVGQLGHGDTAAYKAPHMKLLVVCRLQVVLWLVSLVMVTQLHTRHHIK